jgi:FlaA1/EpsC-like NDP-sugar epimerase
MISRVSILAATSAVAARQYIKSRSTETTCASLATKDGRFKGKTVVITGGGGAFGKEGAAYFCAQGANVVLIDSSQSSLDSAAERVAKDLMLENNAKSPEDAMEIEQSEFTEIDNLSVCTCDVQDEMMVSSHRLIHLSGLII